MIQYKDLFLFALVCFNISGLAISDNSREHGGAGNRNMAQSTVSEAAYEVVLQNLSDCRTAKSGLERGLAEATQGAVIFAGGAGFNREDKKRDCVGSLKQQCPGHLQKVRVGFSDYSTSLAVCAAICL